MTSVRHNGKTLLMTILAIGCMALVLLWPQWRDEVRAQTSSDIQEHLVHPICWIYRCPASPEQENACECSLPPSDQRVPATAGGCPILGGRCAFIAVQE